MRTSPTLFIILPYFFFFFSSNIENPNTTIPIPSSLQAVSNFEGSVKEVDVKLSASGNKGSEAHHQRNQKVEVTVYTLRHGVIRVEDTEDDLYAAVDLVTDKLRRKMTRMKEKAVQKKTWPGRGGSKGAEGIEAHIDPESSDDELPIDSTASAIAPEIVREKILFLEGTSTMSPEEAVDQLEAVGHDFFVFLDAKDGAMKVVYRRRSNGYGLLIPQVQ
jgi:putative sigma-54 modulation protein